MAAFEDLTVGVRRPKGEILWRKWGTGTSLSALVSAPSVVVLYLGPSTVEDTDVRRCQEVAYRRADRGRHSRGAARGGLLFAATATAGTGCPTATASAAAGPVRPRLTGGAVVREI